MMSLSLRSRFSAFSCAATFPRTNAVRSPCKSKQANPLPVSMSCFTRNRSSDDFPVPVLPSIPTCSARRLFGILIGIPRYLLVENLEADIEIGVP
jgi:hypothetical protein